MTEDTGPADPAGPQSWNRYGYTLGDPLNFNDPDGRLAYNVSYDGGWGCVASPSSISEQHADPYCPVGSRSVFPRGLAIQTRTQRVMEIVDPLADYIDDWDYGNAQGTSLNLLLTSQASAALIQGGVIAQGAGGVLIWVGLATTPPGWVITVTVTGAIILTVAIQNSGAIQNILRRAVDAIRRESPGERTIRCANEYLQDLGACHGAYPNDPQALARCYDAARAKKNRCLGIGVQ